MHRLFKTGALRDKTMKIVERRMVDVSVEYIQLNY